MDSAEPDAGDDDEPERAQVSGPADEEDSAATRDDADGCDSEDAPPDDVGDTDDVDSADEADDEEDETSRPTLQQRLSPLVTIITTVHPQGLVIQVNRLFQQRVAAVSYERLVLDPTTLVSLRPELLWTAAMLCTFGLAAALPGSPLAVELLPGLRALSAQLPAWLAGGLLAAAVLTLLLALSFRRRVTLFLDRETGLHPSFVRDGADDAQVAEFVLAVRRAIIHHRCRPPDEDDGVQPAPPRLVAMLDELLAMRQQELLTDGEFDHFRELALRR